MKKISYRSNLLRPGDRCAGHPHDDEANLADPLGDLLLSVAAILILAALVLLPVGTDFQQSIGKRTDTTRNAESSHASRHDGRLDFGNRNVIPLIATNTGLQFGREQSAFAALDRMLDSEKLQRKLIDIEESGASALLLIEPDGLESAFVFDAVARTILARPIIQIRLSRSCDQIASVRAFCALEAGSVSD